jgi:SAM-dependent methyltransferase
MPGLPFPKAAFDAVTASFVISHLVSYADGLADMSRICKPGGHVGVTAWGTLPNPAGGLWKQVAMTTEGGEPLSEAFRSAIPWDEWLSHTDNLEHALREARLTDVAVVRRDFVVSVSAADYVAMKGATVEGTLLRRILTIERWHQFTHEVTEAFHPRSVTSSNSHGTFPSAPALRHQLQSPLGTGSFTCVRWPSSSSQG